jgi:HAD superfamily phosphoserine phosphatase-like hydrolase
MRIPVKPRNVVAFCDFNGTIVDRDMLDYLASTTDSGGENVPTPLERDCRADIERRARALRYSREEAERQIENGIRFDDSFLDFCDACSAACVELLVVTSGVQELVERYLMRRGVALSVIGNAAELRDDGWRVHFRDDSLAGIDKRAFVERAHNEGRTAIVIGDDRSDFEAALAADTVYAKRGSELQRFLGLQLRECRPFDRFLDIVVGWPPATW